MDQVNPVRFVEVKPIEMHYHWPLVKQGLEDIIRKIGARHIDWQPEDVYMAIRNGTTKLVVATNEDLYYVGWFTHYTEVRGWSGKKHLMVWHVWGRPERDWHPLVKEAMREGMEYLKRIAQSEDCDSLMMITSAKIRRAWTRYGFELGVTSWRLWL